MSLNDSKEAFMKRMKSQPIIKKQVIAVREPEKEETLIQTQVAEVTSAVPFFYTSATVSLNRQIFDIITLLRTEDKPLNNNDIIRKLAIDVQADEELFSKLKDNERITYDESSRTFLFKPRYDVRTPESVMVLLEKNRGQTGMNVKELKDSYPGVVDIVEDLAKENKVLVTRAKDGSARVVYYNDASLNLNISSEFKSLWHKVEIKYDMDLPRELEKVGLKSMRVDADPNAVKGPVVKKKKKRASRFKITNKHLEGLDLKSVNI